MSFLLNAETIYTLLENLNLRHCYRTSTSDTIQELTIIRKACLHDQVFPLSRILVTWRADQEIERHEKSHDEVQRVFVSDFTSWYKSSKCDTSYFPFHWRSICFTERDSQYNI